MSKRSKLLLLVAAAVVAIGGITYFSARSTSEPKYNGHTLSEWLEIRSQSTWGQNPSTTRSNEAVQAILHIGTNGLPLAVEWLRFQPSTNAGGLDSSIERVTFRAPLTSSLKQSIFKALHAGERLSGYAMDEFYLLRADASPAIPALVELAHQTNALWPSVRAIICLGYCKKRFCHSPSFRT